MIEPPESPIPPPQAPGSIGQPGLTTNTIKPKGPFGGNLKAVIAIGLAAFLGLGLLLMPSPKKRSTTGTTPAAPIVGGDPTQKAAQMRNAAKDEGERQKRDEDAAQEALGIAQGADTTPLYDAHGQLIPPAQRSKVYKQPYEGGNGAPLHPNQPAPPVAKTALQEQQEELEKKEREMEFQSRFQSNLAYHAVPVANEQGKGQDQGQAQGEAATAQRSPATPASAALGAVPRTASMMSQTEKDREEDAYSQEKSTKKRALEVNIDRAVGKPYVIYEGNFLDTVLLNQLDGDSSGPVIVMVTQPFYSHDRQHVLVPEGSKIIGDTKKIGREGFGQQRRMTLTFHRLIMPDGYTVDLDKFTGLNQIGEEGVKDKVNNHYIEIFGTSIALGIIAGAGEIEQGGSSIGASGSQTLVNGMSQSLSQTSGTMLSQFMQIPPTITIRPGNRVKVFLTQDLLLPAYSNHTISPNF
jgi:type IV secretion system protein VirB10